MTPASASFTRAAPRVIAAFAAGASRGLMRELVAFTQCLFTLSDRGFGDCGGDLVGTFLEPARGLAEYDTRARMFARLFSIVPNPAFEVPDQGGSARWRRLRRFVFRRGYWREIARRSEARRHGVTSAASVRMVRRSAAFSRALSEARSPGLEAFLEQGYHAPAADAIALALAGRPAPAILDIATGDGILTSALRERLPGAQLFGTDLLAFPGVVIAESERNPFKDASFDAVCALGILELVVDPERVVAEIARLLKPDGVCAIVSNAMAVKFLSRNPVSYAEGLLGGVWPSVLPPAHGVYEPLTPLPMMHRAFGRDELAGLCRRHLSEVRIQPLHYRHLRKFGLERLAPRLPVVRWFCGNFLVTGRRA